MINAMYTDSRYIYLPL